jgi:Lar family restriction alleviation protein
MSEPIKLLPCPFCGVTPFVRYYQTESLWSHNIVTYTAVECRECNFSFSSETGFELEAPAAWNRRTPPPETAP